MKSRKSTPDIMGNLMSVKTDMEEYHEPTVHTEESGVECSSTHKGLSPSWTRATFIINKDLNEKIKAIAYWDRLTVKEVLHEALMLYMKGRNVRPIPKKKVLEL